MNTHPSITGFTLACLLAGCSSPIGDPAQDAAQAFAEQDFFAARDHAQEAVRADPANDAALEVLARSQLAMGLGEDALGTLDRLASHGAAPEDAGLLAAEAHLQIGDAEAATDLLAGEASAESWRLRALIASLGGDDESVLQAFARGRAASGDKLRLYVAEASWHLARGDPDAAREAVGLAQRAGPDRVETLFVTARLAQLDQNAEIATRAFMAILDKSPLDRPALLGAIAEMGNLGRVDLLRPLVERGFEAYPGDPEFTYLAARLMAADGDWTGVRDLLQSREGALADHPDSRGLYGAALFELGQVELARSYLAPLFRQYPDNAQIRRTYAGVLLALGEKAQAREVIAPLAALPDALAQDRELATRAAQG